MYVFFFASKRFGSLFLKVSYFQENLYFQKIFDRHTCKCVRC